MILSIAKTNEHKMKQSTPPNEFHVDMIQQDDGHDVKSKTTISNGNDITTIVSASKHHVLSSTESVNNHLLLCQSSNNNKTSTTTTRIVGVGEDNNNDNIVFDRDRLDVLLKCEDSLHYKKHDWIRKAIVKRYKQQRCYQNNNTNIDVSVNITTNGTKIDGNGNSISNNYADPYHCPHDSSTKTRTITTSNVGLVEEICTASITQEEDEEYDADAYNDNINNDIMIDRNCRTLMIQWYYDTIGVCDMDQYETIEIATSYMDRFMDTKKGQYIVLYNKRQLFQLISVACLYMSMKLFEPMIINSNTMVNILCNEQYTIQELERIEILILNVLQWNVLHTPTTILFLYEYIDILLYEMNILLLPNQIDADNEEQKQMILVTAKEYTKQYHKSNNPIHMIMKSSKIAYYSILHAFASVIIKPIMSRSEQIVSKQQMNDFLKRFRKSINIDSIFGREVSNTTYNKNTSITPTKDSSSFSDVNSYHRIRCHHRKKQQVDDRIRRNLYRKKQQVDDDIKMIPKPATTTTTTAISSIDNIDHEEVECYNGIDDTTTSNNSSNSSSIIIIKDDIDDSIDKTKHSRRISFDTTVASSNSMSSTTNDNSCSTKNHSLSSSVLLPKNMNNNSSSLINDTSPNNVVFGFDDGVTVG